MEKMRINKKRPSIHIFFSLSSCALSPFAWFSVEGQPSERGEKVVRKYKGQVKFNKGVFSSERNAFNYISL